MRILITGNMGYVGPWVVRQLRSADPSSTLIGLDLGYFSHCLTHAAILPECRIDVQHFGDVRTCPDSVLRGVEAVVHLAAVSNDPMGKAFEDVTMEINHRATVALAANAKKHGVRTFVFASSCSVYGFAEEAARTEKSGVAPLTAYARSKVMSEGDLGTLADSTFRVVCLRFPTACGMSDRLRLDLVLNDFVAAAVASRKITVLSDGTPWRPLINVRDMARAIEWAVTKADNSGRDFLVVNAGREEWNYQVRDLAHAVARVFGDVEISINANAQPDKRSYKVDFSLFGSLAPGYLPQADLTSTIREVKVGLEAMGFSDQNFRGSSLMRLNVLKELQSSGLLNDRLEWTREGRSIAVRNATRLVPSQS